MNGFRILGVKPLSNCDTKFRKNLSEDKLYPFYLDCLKENDGGVHPTDNIDFSLDRLIFNKSNSSEITISAIVGENGSGKSTIIELLAAFSFLIYLKYPRIKSKAKENYKKTLLEKEQEYRTVMKETLLIEDFPSNLIRQYLNTKEKLDYFENKEYIESFKGFNCELFFVMIENEEKIFYKIKGVSRKISFFIWKNNNWEFRDFSTIPSLKENYFYSILLNYSIYSFRRRDFGQWIELIYHKNDAYTTPFVINPMKTDGNIDVNNELSLQHERLFDSIKRSNMILGREIDNLEFSFKEDFQKYNFFYNVEEDILERQVSNKNSNYYINKNGKQLKIDDLSIQNQDVTDLFSLTIGIRAFTDLEIRIIKYLFKKAVKYYLYYQDNTKESSTHNVRVHNFKKMHNKIYANHSFKEKKYKSAFWLLKSEKFKQLFKDCRMEIPYEAFKNQIKDIEGTRLPLDFLKLDFTFKDGSKYSNLSSGQLQLLNSINTVTYHLNNLESDPNGYKFVSVILDEVELYLHPEFQRQYLKLLLDAVKQIDFIKLKGIHFLVVTHSPFVLSDIPHTNILQLSNDKNIDKRKLIETKTFGANIHKLLADRYFLNNGYQGLISIEVINKVYDFLSVKLMEKEIENFKKEKHRSEIFKDEILSLEKELKELDHAKHYIFTDKEIQKIIGLIGEPILTEELKELFEQLFDHDKEQSISEIKKIMAEKGIKPEDL